MFLWRQYRSVLAGSVRIIISNSNRLPDQERTRLRLTVPMLENGQVMTSIRMVKAEGGSETDPPMECRVLGFWGNRCQFIVRVLDRLGVEVKTVREGDFVDFGVTLFG